MSRELERLLAQRVARRDLLKYAGMGAGMTAFLAGCKEATSAGGSAPSGSTATHAPMSEEPGSLQVFDWSGYGNGDYYPSKEQEFLWQAYKDVTGDTPQFTLFENDDAGFTKVAAGTHYDVVHPCAYRFKDYTDLGVLQPWDTSHISNYSALNPTLEQFGQIDGQQYFIVEDWGFIAPLYRSDKVQPREDSWSLLWDDRYAGKISWINTLEMLVIAGFYHEIADPWNMTDDELAQMRDFLIEKRPLVRFMWDQSYELWQAFKREEVWIGYSWPDTVGYAKTAGMDVVYMEPREGRITWSCGFGLFNDTQNYEHAHAYVDSWSSAKAAGFLLSYYYYGHANTNVDLSNVPQAIIQAFSLDDLSILEPPRSNPESYIPRRSVYSDYWQEVLAA